MPWTVANFSDYRLHMRMKTNSAVERNYEFLHKPVVFQRQVTAEEFFNTVAVVPVNRCHLMTSGMVRLQLTVHVRRSFELQNLKHAAVAIGSNKIERPIETLAFNELSTDVELLASFSWHVGVYVPNGNTQRLKLWETHVSSFIYIIVSN
jgi:hypothetical protein